MPGGWRHRGGAGSALSAITRLPGRTSTDRPMRRRDTGRADRARRRPRVRRRCRRRRRPHASRRRGRPGCRRRRAGRGWHRRVPSPRRAAPAPQGHGLGNADAAVVETDEPRRARQVDRAHLVGTARELEQPAATDDDGAVRARHDGRRPRARREVRSPPPGATATGASNAGSITGIVELEASAQTRRAADGRAADHAGPEHAARDDLAEQPPHSHTTRHAHGRSDDRALHARRSGQPHVTGRRAHRSGLHAHVRGEPHRVRAEDGVGVERGL